MLCIAKVESILMIEKYSCYEFEIMPWSDSEIRQGWVYVIFDPYYKPCDHTIVRESQEWFETQQEARFAAIGHIDLLENGEG